MFPFDTMKTIMQVRNAPAGAGGGAPAMAASEWGVLPAFAQMAEQQGMRRLWRGVQTMFTGCIPAHSAYFTIYESCKPVFGQWLARAPHDAAAAEAGGAAAAAAATAVTVPVPPREAALAAGAAVALGTMVHDLVMTPMDVCKQRLQLGYHKNSVYDCACAIMRQEGARAFVISYPTTVVMNIPYALVMGTTNEARPVPTPTPNPDPDPYMRTHPTCTCTYTHDAHDQRGAGPSVCMDAPCRRHPTHCLRACLPRRFATPSIPRGTSASGGTSRRARRRASWRRPRPTRSTL
eukprot:scaffold107600_cov66-Phaeocystis_antarctica.AAC.7